MTSDEDPPSIYVAHDLDDLFNALPTFLGFKPEESIVAVATHGPRRRFGFRLRIDVPTAFADVGKAADEVLYHLHRHRPDGVLVLALTSRQDIARAVLAGIEAGLGQIEPVAIARSDGRRYWVDDVPEFPEEGIEYETSDHHVAIVSAVAAGQEILPSREALAERVAAPSPELQDELAAVYADVWSRILGIMGSDPADLIAAAQADLSETLERIESGAELELEQVVTLCVWLNSGEVRDAIWSEHVRPDPRAWLAPLCRCSRHALELFAPSVLSMTALAAWSTGNGALALMAADRATAIDPDHPLALTMLALLTEGVPPPSWQEREERRRAG